MIKLMKKRSYREFNMGKNPIGFNSVQEEEKFVSEFGQMFDRQTYGQTNKQNFFLFFSYH